MGTNARYCTHRFQLCGRVPVFDVVELAPIPGFAPDFRRLNWYTLFSYALARKKKATDKRNNSNGRVKLPKRFVSKYPHKFSKGKQQFLQGTTNSPESGYRKGTAGGADRQHVSCVQRGRLQEACRLFTENAQTQCDGQDEPFRCHDSTGSVPCNVL